MSLVDLASFDPYPSDVRFATDALDAPGKNSRLPRSDCSRCTQSVEKKMKVTSKVVRGITGDLIVCTYRRKTINVIIRQGRTLRDASALGDIESEVDIHCGLVDDIDAVTELISEPLTRAKSGDLVILLCPDEKTRQAVLAVLGVDGLARKSDVH
jgi:hypothetical protein